MRLNRGKCSLPEVGGMQTDEKVSEGATFQKEEQDAVQRSVQGHDEHALGVAAFCGLFVKVGGIEGWLFQLIIGRRCEILTHHSVRLLGEICSEGQSFITTACLLLPHCYASGDFNARND